MLFPLSPRVEDLKQRVTAFMEEHVYPAEDVFERQLEELPSRWHVPPVMEELKARKRVLRRLGFTNSVDIVDMKGRVACEISTGDELLLTELIFNGVFNSLSPEQCAGLLSCFVFTEKVRC